MTTSPDVLFKRLFEPGTIGNVRVKNRIVMAALGNSFWGCNGEVTDRLIDHYAAIAKGGAGLITVSYVTVDYPPGYGDLGSLYSRNMLAGHYTLVERLHAYGAKVSLQIMHKGRQVSPHPGLRIVSSSSVPVAFLGETPGPLPEPVSKADLKTIIDHYGTIAGYAKQAGYDMIEIHGAHGYLINSFMSPYLNTRGDEYGGSLENRMRFPTELIEYLKEKVGNDFPVGFRISADEFVNGGMTTAESPMMAGMLEKVGAAFIHVSSGLHETAHKCSDMMRLPEGWKSYIWEAVKKAISIPTFAVGVNRSPEFCEKILEEEKADFIAMARQLLADPDWPNKAREGRLEDIRKCISCMECLGPMTGRAADTRCSINVSVGRQKEFTTIGRAPVKKKVMVIGAGPGGMEAARIAALRGHEVMLYDKRKELGGQLLLASVPPGKDKLLWFRDYEAVQLQKLNVKIELEVEVTPELIDAVSPDQVVMATGSKPIVFGISGIAEKRTLTAWQVLEGKVRIEDARIVIVGGGIVGAETAEFLVEKGNAVTVVEQLPVLAQGMEPLNRKGLLDALAEKQVTILLGHKVVQGTDKGIIVLNVKNGLTKVVEADRIILAMGVIPNDELAHVLEDRGTEVYVVGDCRKPRTIMAAVYEGAFAAMQF